MNTPEVNDELRKRDSEIRRLRLQLESARADLNAKNAFIREIRSTEIEFEEALEERSTALEDAAREIARLKAFRFDVWLAAGIRRIARRLRSQ
jgi:chromosome segregation ATPase